MMRSATYDDALAVFAEMERARQSGDDAAFDDCVRRLNGFRTSSDEKEDEWTLDGVESPSFTQKLRRYFATFHAARMPPKSSRACDADFVNTPEQERIRMFFGHGTPYRSLLLAHQTGAGKTCTAITAVEALRDASDKRPLVLLPAHLKKNFIDNVLDVDRLRYDDTGALLDDDTQQCLGNTYLKMIPDRFALTRSLLRRKATRLIVDRFFDIMSYGEFANHLERIEQTVARAVRSPGAARMAFRDKVHSLYSNRTVVIDEVHNLRADTDNPDRKIVPPRIMQLLTYTENVKLLMMSATPMFNSAKEIVFIANLMLANEKLPTLRVSDVFDAEGALTPDGRAALADACYGRVSYVAYREQQYPPVFPFKFEPGDRRRLMRTAPTKDTHGRPARSRIDLTLMPLVVAKTAPEFSHLFRHVRSMWTDEEDALDLHVGLQLSNVCFPGTTGSDLHQRYGQNAFARCFVTSTRSGQTCLSYAPDIAPFLDEQNVARHAPKIANIVDSIVSCRGVALVYASYVQTGVMAVALALEHRGFTRYNGPDMLIGKPRANGPAYIVLTGDVKVCSSETDFATARSPANARGDIVKVIICSRKGSEGLDMKFVREVHVLDPWYNVNRLRQVIGRARRRCSHALLPPEEQNCTVFLHAAVDDPDEESVDVRVYHMAQDKQRRMDEVTDLIRDVSLESIIADGDGGDDEESRTKEVAQIDSQGKRRTADIYETVPPRRSSARVAEPESDDRFFAMSVIDHVSSALPSVLEDGRYATVSDVADAIGLTEHAVARALEYIVAYRPAARLMRAGDHYALIPQTRARDSAVRPFDTLLAAHNETLSNDSDDATYFRSQIETPFQKWLERFATPPGPRVIDCIIDMFVDRSDVRRILRVALQDEPRPALAPLVVESAVRAGALLHLSDRIYVRDASDGLLYKFRARRFEHASVSDIERIARESAPPTPPKRRLARVLWRGKHVVFDVPKGSVTAAAMRQRIVQSKVLPVPPSASRAVRDMYELALRLNDDVDRPWAWMMT
jgi:hypothetical protein